MTTNKDLAIRNIEQEFEKLSNNPFFKAKIFNFDNQIVGFDDIINTIKSKAKKEEILNFFSVVLKNFDSIYKENMFSKKASSCGCNKNLTKEDKKPDDCWCKKKNQDEIKD